MTAAALLQSVVAALDTAAVPFMLTGSLAAAYHGAGRATMDIDMVIAPSAAQLRSLVRALAGTGAYLSPEAAEEAFAHQSMFNVVDRVLLRPLPYPVSPNVVSFVASDATSLRMTNKL